jgi:hypothetical protein
LVTVIVHLNRSFASTVGGPLLVIARSACDSEGIGCAGTVIVALPGLFVGADRPLVHAR